MFHPESWLIVSSVLISILAHKIILAEFVNSVSLSDPLFSSSWALGGYRGALSVFA